MSWVIGHGFSTDPVQTCSTDMRTDMQYRHAVQTCRAVHHFLNSVKNLLQISMDDPNVNWKMLKLVKEDRKSQDPTSPDMLELGSCGLHVLCMEPTAQDRIQKIGSLKNHQKLSILSSGNLQ